ncbi:hypothetical protein ACQPW1_13200 [Nocardia sp. CA-128927]|uniref:hypothetical protein n=1 Tax=Nocardia sp. CA-128927 TaxID=3239975 RepID=UPI003D99323D
MANPPLGWRPETPHIEPATQSADHSPPQDTPERGQSGPWVDADGREHYPRDPQNTWRDANGQIHGQDGRFTNDPYRRSEVDVEAQRGDARSHEMSDAARSRHLELAAEREQAKRERDKLIQHRDQLANELGVAAKDLNRQNRRATIERLRIHALMVGDASQIARIDALERAATETSQAIWAVVDRAEQAGMNGARDLIREHALILTGREGEGPGKANTLDLVALVSRGPGQDPHLLVLEAKGFGSTLGSRMVDGLRVEQGTREYLDWMLKNDQALQQARQELARTNPELSRVVEQAIAQGRVDYQLVHVELDRVTVTEFNIEPRVQTQELGVDLVRTPELVQEQWREQARGFLQQADVRFVEAIERQIEQINQQPLRADQHGPAFSARQVEERQQQREQELAYRRQDIERLQAHAAQYRESLQALAAGDLERVAAVAKFYGRNPDARLVAEPVREQQPDRTTAPPVLHIEVNRGPDLEPVRVPFDSQLRRDTLIALRMWEGLDPRTLDIIRVTDIGGATPAQALELQEIQEREAAQRTAARERDGRGQERGRER